MYFIYVLFFNYYDVLVQFYLFLFLFLNNCFFGLILFDFFFYDHNLGSAWLSFEGHIKLVEGGHDAAGHMLDVGKRARVRGLHNGRGRRRRG
jgi:hypothetical protein